jgi:putative transposase
MQLAPQEIRTFFVTSVSYGRKAILQSHRMAGLLIDVMQQNRKRGRFLLHEFVVMPDHIHLLITPAPAVSLEKAMQYIKGGYSFRAKKELVYPGSVWQDSFDNHRIRGAIDYERHRNYIHQNPVRRGLAPTASEYPYSSACPGAVVDPAPPALKRTV